MKQNQKIERKHCFFYHTVLSSDSLSLPALAQTYLLSQSHCGCAARHWAATHSPLRTYPTQWPTQPPIANAASCGCVGERGRQAGSGCHVTLRLDEGENNGMISKKSHLTLNFVKFQLHSASTVYMILQSFK